MATFALLSKRKSSIHSLTLFSFFYFFDFPICEEEIHTLARTPMCNSCWVESMAHLVSLSAGLEVVQITEAAGRRLPKAITIVDSKPQYHWEASLFRETVSLAEGQGHHQGPIPSCGIPLQSQALRTNFMRDIFICKSLGQKQCSDFHCCQWCYLVSLGSPGSLLNQIRCRDLIW